MSIASRRLQKAKKPVPSPSTWPDASNTGWAVTGATLTNYTGPSFMNNAGAVTLDSKTTSYFQINGATQLTLTRCQVNGFIDVVHPATLVIEDSNIDAGQTSMGAISGDNITIRRCNITGGQHSVQCHGNGLIEDSYLHDQWNDPNSSFHLNAYISNGGSNVTLRHNRLKCDSPVNVNDGGPTGDASIFGDWATPTNFTFDNNLFMPTTGSYGGSFGYNPGKPYGSNPSNIVVTNNVFQRGSSGQCGVYGPVTSFLVGAPGNVWSNNTYEDDGAIILPA